MRSIRNRKKAQERWNKLRKYVTFTWGRGLLPLEDKAFVEKECCNCFAVPKRRKQARTDNISFNTKVTTQSEKVVHNMNCKDEKNGNCSMHSNNADTPQHDIPLPPSLEIMAGSEISIPEIQKNLKNLYEYNVMLREKLVSTRSAIRALTSKASASSLDQRHQ